MSTSETCPLCKSDLRYQPIGAGDGTTCKFYSRMIGVEVPGVYDGVLYWMCPDCGGKWHRFSEGHYLRVRAAPWVDGAEPHA